MFHFMNNIDTVIDVNHLNKSFNGKPAVVDFSLSIKQGEICGFLGPNGSGKTTTLRMLCGLLTPDSGNGTCLGFDIVKQSYDIKLQVGYMTQGFSLYHDLTAYENLDFIARAYGIKHRKHKILETFKTFNLDEYKTILAGNLSGGWKQRLALAGCLLHDPKLLLLDEPTAGVDPKARREFWEEIHKLSARGITTLVSTHYMDEAERCTQLAYIAYGHLLASGTASSIVAHANLHTWTVTGDKLNELSEKLNKLPGIDQVAFFGNKLHVSGKDEQHLNQAISIFAHSHTWTKTTPNLEDVFISLVSQTKEAV